MGFSPTDLPVDALKRIIAIATVSLFLFSPLSAFARGGGRGHGGQRSGSHSRSYHSGSRSYRSHSGGGHTSKAVGVKRDSRGKIKRSQEAKKKFMKQSGYPHGRPGYVVDHIVPLKKGGSDTPSNMQWQTKDAAEAKDRWE